MTEQNLMKVEAPVLDRSTAEAENLANIRRPVRNDVMNVRSPKPLKAAFLAIREDLERRSREWVTMAHLVEQNRLHLAAAEIERDAAYKLLAEIVPTVEETARALKGAMESNKDSDNPTDLKALFDNSDRALERLERVASDLSAQLAWCRSTWEQYSSTVEREKELRSHMLGNRAG